MRGLASLIFIIFVSCNSGEKDSVDLYFDLEAKVNLTVDQLVANSHVLTKFASLNDETDTALVEPDTLQWKRELELFSTANINKIQYKGVYAVEDKNDENSNLQIRTYTHLDPEKANVTWMEVHYLEDFERVSFIKLNYKENNAGFSVYRDLSMNYEAIRGEYFLSSYSIEGYQKILGQDTVQFNIVGDISY